MTSRAGRERAKQRDEVLSHLAVSRETAAALDRYVALLDTWHSTQNLVAASTLPAVWSRHILDSAQLLPLLSDAERITDFGSGAGFPGLVLAILRTGRAVAPVDLVESNGRKAAFLREAVRVTAAPALVHAMRAERYTETPPGHVGAVTARALAPLRELLRLAEPLLKTGARGVFLKGREAQQELTDAARSWRIDAELRPSLTDSAARIVLVRSAVRTAADRWT